MRRFEYRFTTTDTTEKAHFLESALQSGIGNCEARDIDNIAKGLIIVGLSGTQKDTILMDTSFPAAGSCFGAAFEGFVVIGADNSGDRTLTTAHLIGDFSRGAAPMSQCEDSHDF
jgi:hypothetical protein